MDFPWGGPFALRKKRIVVRSVDGKKSGCYTEIIG